MWNDFEHQIWNRIKENGLLDISDRRFALAVSGGLDSMCLLHLFHRLGLLPRCQVFHVHHGDFENKDFRDQAMALVVKTCQNLNVNLISVRSAVRLQSEAEFREYRNQFFQQNLSADDILVTGHHQDDLLETRLIQMIRGTHTEGLASFRMWNGHILRPLLYQTRADLMSYAKIQKVSYLEDPTNLNPDYLRNWIRHHWLPALEQRHPGGVSNLGRSLDYLIEDLDPKQELLDCPIQNRENSYSVKSVDFLTLSTKDQMKILAKLLKMSGQREFTTGHLKEILKRLDKNQKEHTFHILGRNWLIHSGEIVLELPDTVS